MRIVHSLRKARPLSVKLVLACALIAFGFAASANAATLSYAVTGKIAGPDGGWDLLGVDPVAERTSALYEATGKLYLPSAQYAPAVGTARPAMVPGSFAALIVSPVKP